MRHGTKSTASDVTELTPDLVCEPQVFPRISSPITELAPYLIQDMSGLVVSQIYPLSLTTGVWTLYVSHCDETSIISHDLSSVFRHPGSKCSPFMPSVPGHNFTYFTQIRTNAPTTYADIYRRTTFDLSSLIHLERTNLQCRAPSKSKSVCRVGLLTFRTSKHRINVYNTVFVPTIV
jgi:hypothetical protein